MSGFVSAARRVAGIPIVQDACAFVAMGAFLAAAAYGSAGLAIVVAVLRGAQ